MNDLDLAAEYTNRLMQGFLSDQTLDQVYFIGIERRQAEAALSDLQRSDGTYKAVLKVGDC